jgi:glutamate synthase (NADPH/NADH) small chain
MRHAEEEGVRFHWRTQPLRIVGDPEGEVVGLEVQRTEPGEPDASGRSRPVPVAGSEQVLEVDTVVEAIGQRPNPIVQATTPGLATGRGGIVVVDDAQRTSRAGVFAGGDLSRGGATVILAMRDGRRAAAAIHEALTTDVSACPQTGPIAAQS